MKDCTVSHKTDTELKALLLAFAVCPSCADRAVAAMRAGQEIRGKPHGFEPCSDVCVDGILSAMTVQMQ
jgi:hypothetical protein